MTCQIGHNNKSAQSQCGNGNTTDYPQRPCHVQMGAPTWPEQAKRADKLHTHDKFVMSCLSYDYTRWCPKNENRPGANTGSVFLGARLALADALAA